MGCQIHSSSWLSLLKDLKKFGGVGRYSSNFLERSMAVMHK
jgi:hypothetical protein